MEWPTSVRDTLRHLAEAQEYARFWKAILLMYFPLEHGFRIGKISEAHTLKNKTLVVRKGVEIILIVTYDPPSHLSRGCFSDRYFGDTLKQPTTPRLQSVGLIVAWLYDSDEAGGNSLLIECFRDAWKQSGLTHTFSPDEPDIKAALDFLKLPSRADKPPGAESDASTRYQRNYRNASPPNNWPTVSSAGSFQKAFPVDFVLMFISYLSRQDLESFSLASSVCNNIANRLLWRTFCLSWTEQDTKARLDQMFHALIRNPRRAACIIRLKVLCGWAWSSERLDHFRQAISKMVRLETLIFRPPLDTFRNPAYTMGNEFSPLFRMLTARASELEITLRHFVFESFVRPSSPLFHFLRTQPHLEWLDGIRLDVKRPTEIPTDVLPNLKHLRTGCVPSTIAWMDTRPTTREWIAEDSTYHYFPKYVDRPASEILRILNKLERSPQIDLDAITIHCYGTPQDGTDDNVLARLATACPRLRYLRLHRTIQPCEIRSLENLPLLEFLGCHTVERSERELTKERILAWLNLLPCHIKQVEPMKDLQLCSRHSGHDASIMEKVNPNPTAEDRPINAALPLGDSVARVGAPEGSNMDHGADLAAKEAQPVTDIDASGWYIQSISESVPMVHMY